MVFVDWLMATKALIMFAEKAKMEPIPKDDKAALKRLIDSAREDMEKSLR